MICNKLVKKRVGQKTSRSLSKTVSVISKQNSAIIVRVVTVLVPWRHHCAKFALSDPDDLDLQEQCKHEHTSTCNQCDDIAVCLDKIEHAIKDNGTKF